MNIKKVRDLEIGDVISFFGDDLVSHYTVWSIVMMEDPSMCHLHVLRSFTDGGEATWEVPYDLLVLEDSEFFS